MREKARRTVNPVSRLRRPATECGSSVWLLVRTRAAQLGVKVTLTRPRPGNSLDWSVLPDDIKLYN